MIMFANMTPWVSGQTIDPRATMFPPKTASRISATPHRDQKAQDFTRLGVCHYLPLVPLFLLSPFLLGLSAPLALFLGLCAFLGLRLPLRFFGAVLRLSSS